MSTDTREAMAALMTEKELLAIVDQLIRDVAYNRPAAVAIGMAVGAAVEAEVRRRAAALATQPAQPSAQGEAVAWIRQDWSGSGQRTLSFEGPPDPKPLRDEVVNPVWTPLYASAPAASAQAVPLTDEQLEAIMADLNGSLTGPRGWGWKDVARAIERAHGIKAAP